MDKYESWAKAADLMNGTEREAMKRTLQLIETLPSVQRQLAMDELIRVGQSWVAGRRKSAANRKSDLRRRVLVGARVPRERAEAYRHAADQAGVSLYKWCFDAFEAACAATAAGA